MILPIENLWWLDILMFGGLFVIGLIAFGGITFLLIDLSFKLIDIIKKHCAKDK